MELEHKASLTIIGTSIPILPRQYNHTIQIMAAVLGIPIILISLIGNLLTIIATIKTKSLRTSPNIFIISLSISDMLFASTIIPSTIAVYWKNRWILGSPYCRMFPMLLTMLFGGTLVSLTGIAISRFLKILHPNVHQKVFGRKWHAVAIVTAFWLCPPIMLLPAVCGLWGDIGYDSKTLTCTVLNDESGYSTFLLVAAFLLPITVITFCYVKILLKLYKNHKRIAHMRQNGLTCVRGSDSQQNHQQNQQREDFQFTKMMVLIFIIFSVTYTPNLLNNLLDPVIEDMNRRAIFVMFKWFSCCLNPLVYVMLNKHFRRPFADICACGKSNSHVHSINSRNWDGLYHIEK